MFSRIKNGSQANYYVLINRIQARGLKVLFQPVSTPSLYLPLPDLNPERVSAVISVSFTLLSILIGGVLILHVLQLPYPNVQLSPAKGVTLYSAHEAQQAYALFGSKPIELGTIQLRGVVITEKSADGTDTGFVLLEIDGKAIGPVGLGENIGKGMVVKTINPDGATLVYQGQKIDLTLSKAQPKKAPTGRLNLGNNSAMSPNSPTNSTNEVTKSPR
jgi:hypothetical protein